MAMHGASAPPQQPLALWLRTLAAAVLSQLPLARRTHRTGRHSAAWRLPAHQSQHDAAAGGGVGHTQPQLPFRPGATCLQSAMLWPLAVLQAIPS